MKKVECKELSLDGKNWFRFAVNDGNTLLISNIDIEPLYYPFQRNIIIEVSKETKLKDLL